MPVSRETLIATYFGERSEEISRYAEILATWGIDRGLVGPKEGPRIWDRHIANCIPVTTLIPQEATVLDVGSGAGLPGIVIALARPDLKVTLLEPLQRRVDFLEEVKAALGLDIVIKRGRADSFKGSFKVVTARAVAPLPKLATISWHFVAPGGSLLAMKGESATSELEQARIEVPKVFKKVAKAEVHEISIGELELARVIELQKAG
jgi:16S rRNA (guanine527-N7)-methyltransferase